ncbi:MAG: type IX secretion system membrane protein PorP/SprF [Cytophagaceae bacterium]|jgi:hypothetical protein|nr:type IX secretion system membrane protein PorP/SprF [Cytophagaceae bacterium]
MLFWNFLANAQKVFSPYPFHFDHIFNLGNFYHPGFDHRDKKDYIQIGYNDFNPLSNTIASYYLNGKFSFGKTAIKSHRLGAFIINDREGEFLGRLKMMAQYSFVLPLGPQFSWHNGIGLGVLNHTLKSNDIIGGESSFTFDSDLGTFLRWKNHYFGVSVNQLTNRRQYFLNGTFSIPRYYSMYLGTSLKLTEGLVLLMDGYARTGSILYNKYAVSFRVDIQKHITTGINIKSANGFMPLLGIRDIRVGDHSFSCLFSYSVPTSKIILSGSGNFEMQLEYKFR